MWLWILYIVLGIIAIIVLYVVIWVIRGSRSHEFLEREQKRNKEILERNDEQLRRNDERIRRNDERIRRSGESIKYSEETARKMKETSKTLDILERQVRNNLFTETEMLEITREKNHVTQLTLRAVEATDALTRLIKKQPKLILSLKDKDEEVWALDKEIEEMDQKVRAYDEELLACFPAIEKWIELGRQREANGGLTNFR